MGWVWISSYWSTLGNHFILQAQLTHLENEDIAYLTHKAIVRINWDNILRAPTKLSAWEYSGQRHRCVVTHKCFIVPEQPFLDLSFSIHLNTFSAAVGIGTHSVIFPSMQKARILTIGYTIEQHRDFWDKRTHPCPTSDQCNQNLWGFFCVFRYSRRCKWT